jgi:hypothetical protein
MILFALFTQLTEQEYIGFLPCVSDHYPILAVSLKKVDAVAVLFKQSTRLFPAWDYQGNENEDRDLLRYDTVQICVWFPMFHKHDAVHTNDETVSDGVQTFAPVWRQLHLIYAQPWIREWDHVHGVYVTQRRVLDLLTTYRSTLSLFPHYKSVHTKSSQSTFASLYLATALSNAYSSAVFSLDVSWQRILAKHILQLRLPAG